MDVTIKHIRELLEFINECILPGFENCCNIAKQISTVLEIEIKLKDLCIRWKAHYVYMKLRINQLLMRKIILNYAFFVIKYGNRMYKQMV